MDIESVTLVYFSPTGTTKKVLESIAETIGAKEVRTVDLTGPDTMSRTFDEIKDGLVILGSPVYSGRIPEKSAERFRRIKGNGVPVVVVVVYGNREYEDALLELRDIAVEQGFKPVAGGVFIGEHSFSTDETPLSVGRPDAQDIDIARDLGQKLARKMRDTVSSEDIGELTVPGSNPYRDRHRIDRAPPATNEELCTKCLKCVEACPTAAIACDEEIVTDPESCIFCCACVKVCPNKARSFDNSVVNWIRAWLSKDYGKRKEPELFI